MAITSVIEKLERRWMDNPTGLMFVPLAEAYRQVGNSNRALEILEAGLSQHPEYVPALIVRGRCHADAGDLPAAEAAFDQALARDPVNAIALRGMAEVYERTGRIRLAIDRLAFLLEVDRGDEDARQTVERLRHLAETAGDVIAPLAPDAAPALTEPNVEAPSAFDPGAWTPESWAHPSEQPARSEPSNDAEPAEPPVIATEARPEQGTEPVINVSGVDADEWAAAVETRSGPDHRDERGDSAFSESWAVWATYGPPSAPDAAPPESAVTEQTEPEAAAPEPPSESAPTESPVAEIPADDSTPAEPPLTEATAEEVEAPFVAVMEVPEPQSDSEVDVAEPTQPTDWSVAVTVEVTGQAPSESEEPVAPGLAAEMDEPEAATPLVADLVPDIEADSVEASEPEPEVAVAQTPLVEEPALIVTESMAELFLRQGHRDLALAVYRQLAEQSPDDEGIREAVARLEAEAAPPPGPEPEPAKQVRSWAARDTGGASVEEFLRRVLDAPPPAASASVLPPAIERSQAGAPTQVSGEPLALSAVFGGEPPPPPIAGAESVRSAPPAPIGEEPSYDEFFGTVPGESEPPTAPGPGARPSEAEDLRQFNEWLKGLKR